MVTHFRILSDTIVLLQIADSNISGFSFIDHITLNQNIRNNQHIISLSQNVILNQQVTNNIKRIQIQQNVNLNHNVVVGKIYNLSLQHIINIGDRAVRNKVANITQLINLTQNTNLKPIIPSIINLSQGVTYNVSKPVVSEIILNDSLILNKIKIQNINQNISLNSYSRVYKLDRYFAAINIPNILSNQKIILTYQNLVLQLRDPEFGDTDKYEQSRILRRNRGNELNIYRDETLPWPTTETLTYNFKYLKQNDVHNLLYFMQVSIGQIIQLQDHESNDWEGIIITPEKEVIEESVTGFSASFDFQGNRI